MSKPIVKTAVATKAPNQATVPNHIAFIMDGNRRWAKANGTPKLEGHRRGYQAIKKITKHAVNRGVKEISFFAFSTENWDREEEEVSYLMDLARMVFKAELNDLEKEGLKVRVPGLSDKVAPDLAEMINEVTERTKDNTRATINYCFNYGGRADILQAVNKLILAGKPVTSQEFSKALSTDGMSDVDLLVRTSEYRLSGFLPWESVYAELYFVPNIYWPDFDEKQLDKAIAFFASRQRRFGR